LNLKKDVFNLIKKISIVLKIMEIKSKVLIGHLQVVKGVIKLRNSIEKVIEKKFENHAITSPAPGV